ncbi:MAG: chemotaxis protein CheX [Turneriella sp.]|nr:chemotaxis protein CheX [Turneriella sp.]
MLDFEIFCSALRNAFQQLAGLRELTSELLDHLPDKFNGVTAQIELYGEQPARLWLNIAIVGITLFIKHLEMPLSSEDRILMDATGELLNIIAGNAQRKSAVRYQFSLPVAFKGENYPLRLNDGSRIQVRRFIFSEFETILVLEELS